MSENLEITMEAKKLKELYDKDPRNNSFNSIIYGPTGSGKTSALRTCRLPLHVDSFDPGGTKVLRGEAILNGVRYPDEMGKGNIVVDTSFENEDPFSPTCAQNWQDTFNRRAKMGYFDNLGTYAIDSMTTWAQTIIYRVMKKAGRAGGSPQQNDWLPQMSDIENSMRKFISLPCDCILIGHDDTNKDEATGRMFVTLMITGKLARRVPLLFDEIYYAYTKETSKGIEYQFLTKNSGLFQAKSRLCNRGQIEMYEPANIKDILQKAGLPTDNKSPLF